MEGGARPNSTKALRTQRTLARLESLLDVARQSPFTTGDRRPQPPEVRALQQRVREVTLRWSPYWVTPAAKSRNPPVKLNRDHVVPVVVLVERMLLGDEPAEVLPTSAICVLTYAEHRVELEVAFRIKQRDLYQQMLACPLGDLTDLGWERYRRANIQFLPHS